ncbi:MAG TPA: PaaI family thioesterase [Longimicrobiaceae bacterium]|nr:PaaI family thioesterase [Longimicrobiaceae bacterium]
MRTRTITWDDPMIGARAARGMTGLEYLRAIQRGDLPRPPIAWSLDFTLESVEEGRVVFGMTPGEHHYNPIGVVHGGVAATLLDSAMGSAVHATLPAGVGYATVELKVNLLRAVTLDTGPVRAEGTVLHAGRRTALTEGRLTDAAGRLLAHATSTCLIVRADGAG